MKITHAGRPTSLARPRRVVVGDGRADGFARSIGSGADRAAGIGPAAPLAASGAVLSAQEVPEAAGGRDRVVARGHGILDELQELRLALIEGWVPEDVLRRIATLVEDARPELTDPHLDAALDDIELRAAVELAKAGRR